MLYAACHASFQFPRDLWALSRGQSTAPFGICRTQRRVKFFLGNYPLLSITIHQEHALVVHAEESTLEVALLLFFMLHNLLHHN